ncbi:uncharacterized protein TRIADDRAFT_49927 [Trichoplax adhaerens]|uniref:Uncharacterized protein n=1 Tax=Trichoplax adhaerens TaxID=10228 RepID=B3RQB5_TRIAD|nr:hypothetical protein TRIADDRAFT_49927 [Trichoplax adhaerens]EDV27798.1 hypothetical protein TRIADDRAFT_49927 [Trichoplax adhaerens]|eukprot:XP_002109632.1 hypothetical protein TRIADDRAFT_49927 [Trichoplax adhaerens]
MKRRNSKLIDKELSKEKKSRGRQIKILLLGAGESGKSTFLKQMRIIHGEEYSQKDLMEFKNLIYGNVVKNMRVLITARDSLGIKWANADYEDYAQELLAIDTKSTVFDYAAFMSYAGKVVDLWQDRAIQQTYDKRNLYQLSDSTYYFMDRMKSLMDKAYVPTKQDVLRSRKATTNIVELTLNINRVPFTFVDVGGQRSQRRKWLQCFEGVTSVLFLVSSCAYDQVLLEDNRTNRIVESCQIFDTIINNKFFAKVAIILFFNKTDILIEKVSLVSIKDYFPEFSRDPKKIEDVKHFLITMFEKVSNDQKRGLYHHFTTATDTENIKFVFNAVREMILEENMSILMLQ